MKRLTHEELTKIRNRAEKATEGRWMVEESRYGGEYNVRTTVGFEELTACLSAKSDADFIAHAREDIPKLLAEIERLRKSLERIAWFSEYYSGEIAEEALDNDEAT